jgi:hypothetical protein
VEAPVKDSVTYRPRVFTVLDSVVAAQANRAKQVSDSLAMLYIKSEPAERPNRFVEEMLQSQAYKGNTFLDLPVPAKVDTMPGKTRHVKDNWLVIAVAGLLLYGGLVRIFFWPDINRIIVSTYNKQYFLEIAEEGNFIGFWAFAALLILLGFTFGLFLYLIAGYYEVYYALAGPALFMALTVAVILFFLSKIVVLKVLGFIFGFGSAVNRYIAILCLTYFCLTFAMLPIVVCLGFIGTPLVSIILLFAFVAACFLLLWLYVRNSILVISDFQFSKFYLFTYLCALEICPVLVLIKALNI